MKKPKVSNSLESLVSVFQSSVFTKKSSKQFFDEENKPNIIYAKWQSEDGGRFHLKSNYNMIVEVNEEEELEIPDSFIWVTLYQIKQLMKIENFVGPHVRGIISYL